MGDREDVKGEGLRGRCVERGEGGEHKAILLVYVVIVRETFGVEEGFGIQSAWM